MRGETKLLRYGPIIGLVVVSAAMLVVAPGVLRVAFIGLVAIVAAIVFRQSRPLYIQLCLWIWFLTPWLRRLIDWRTSYSEQSLIISAPFVAAAVSGVVLLRHGRSLAKPGGVPFACALAGILFGTIYGLTRFAPFDVAHGLADWVPPVLFGFFLYEERQRYAEYRDAFTSSLLWGTLTMSVYGITQFFLLPAWDEAWMLGLKWSTFGRPFAREVRVFSTTNAPVVLAFFLTAGLLVALAMLVDGQGSRSRLLPAVTAPLALVCLGLTLSRSLWIAVVVGVLYLVATMPGKMRLRLAAVSLIALAMAAAVSQLPGIRELLVERLKTFTSGTQDVSASARISGHRDALGNLAVEPMGEGMGSTYANHATDGSDDSLGPHDSTLLELLYSLGGPGTLIYTIGIGYGVVLIFAPRGKATRRYREPFSYAMRAVILGFLVQCLLDSILVGVPGLLVWGCVAFGLSSSEAEGRERLVSRASMTFLHRGSRRSDLELSRDSSPESCRPNLSKAKFSCRNLLQ
jgi:hypothetical protein